MKFEEILKAQELTDEQIAGVIGAMKENSIYTAGEENLDIRYGKLKGDHKTVTDQLTEANKLIETMKKDGATAESLKSQIGDYEQKIAELTAENLRIQTDSALKVALLEADADDIDYLTFKIREKGEITMGEDGKITGLSDTIDALKTQFPNHFKGGEAGKKIEENKLQRGEDTKKVTPEQFKQMGYNQRNELFKNDPELYKELAK